ncbi:MAG: starch-binding protein [Ruminococcus sp.]|nr:starch-binding protein [Ruminococcus sp.]
MKSSKKFTSTVLSLSMVMSAFALPTVNAIVTDKNESSAQVDTQASSATNYLVDDQQKGSILQCFNWSFDAIREKIPKIAEQGFTAVQTSPIQTAKEGTAGKTAKGSWWVQYQPADFSIETNANGTGALGTATEFKAMCDEAHKYGVRVIVDAVLNHMANQSKNDLSPKIPAEYRNNSSFWHDISVNSWYKTRHDITQYCMDGVPDLNTGNEQVQNAAIKFLKQCIDCGADGFRFDGAKHIEVPADSGFGSQFWPNVLGTTTSYAQSTKGITPYYYGEVLDKTTGDDDSGNGQNVVNSYTSYMSITLSSVSNDIRNCVNNSNAEGAKRGDFSLDDYSTVKGSRAVLWNESHDTYQAGSSSYVSDYNMNKTWAMVGARAEACGMYMARPSNWNSAMMGQGDTTAWANNEVKAVNLFNNYFVGQSEYLSASGSVAYNERGTSGVVLVNLSGGSQSVSVKANKMKDGTYTDQVSGSTFKVSGGQISGQIGNTGIAVVYNAETSPKATISQAGGNFKTDTLTLTLGLSNATSGTYKIGSEAEKTFTGTTTITIGSGMSYGDKVTVTLKATDGTKTSEAQTYTFTKVDPSAVQRVYFDNSSYNWSSVNAYIYLGASSQNAAWPGVAMTKDSATGYYVVDVPDGLENGLVIFAESASSTNRYPADMEEGLPLGGSTKLFTAGNKLIDYTPVTPTSATTTTKATQTTTTTTPIVKKEYKYGDVNLDGNVNVQDASLIQKYAVKSYDLSGAALIAADVTDDGVVNVKDATSIQKFAVKLISTFKAGTTFTYGDEPITTTTAVQPTTTKATTTTQPTTIASGNKLYLDVSAIATTDARYAVYFFDGQTKNTWADMTSVSGNVYSVDIPSGYEGKSAIFCRMNGATSANTWDNRWNQSADLTIGSANLYKATGWGSGNLFNGEWSGNYNG